MKTAQLVTEDHGVMREVWCFVDCIGTNQNKTHLWLFNIGQNYHPVLAAQEKEHIIQLRDFLNSLDIK